MMVKVWRGAIDFQGFLWLLGQIGMQLGIPVITRRKTAPPSMLQRQAGKHLLVESLPARCSNAACQ